MRSAGRGLLALALALGLGAGCGKQDGTSGGPPPAQPAQPGKAPVEGEAPAAAADGATSAASAMEGLLRGRVGLFGRSAAWQNRLGRFLHARGQHDEALAQLEAAAAADPGNADFLIDVMAARAAKNIPMQDEDLRRLGLMLGAPTDAGAMPMAAAAPAALPPGGVAPQDGPAANAAMPTPPQPPTPTTAPGGAVAGTDPAPVAAAPGVAPPAVPPNAHAAANAAPGAVPPNVATTIAPPVQGAAERTTPTSYAEAVAQARQGIQRGDLSAAAASWQEALKFEPESAEAYLGLADARLMTGDAPAAITGYKEAMRLAPKDPVVAKRLGDACFQARQNECAFSAYETAVKGAPVADDGYVWVRYAHVANQIGKKGAARTALAQASKLLPENDRDLVTVKSAIEGQK